MANLAPNNQKMKINKTESEYNMKSIRFLLLTITAMFMFIGCLMIVLGISVYGTYHNFNFFYNSVKSGHFITPSVLCVFSGLTLMVVSLFGFCGSLKRSTCMVNVYAVFLLIIFILKLVVVILAFTLSSETIDRFLHLPVADYVTDPEIQDEMDSLQNTLGCCGSNSFLDYVGLEFNNNHHTSVITKENEHGEQITVIVPTSCCSSHGEVFCTRMWARGCKQALSELLLQNATVIGVLGISVMFINLLGIVFALLLARCIRKMKSERALLLWKIKEQFILAKEAEDAARTPEEVQPAAPVSDLAPYDQKMKENKTESEYNMKTIKVLLVITTAILMGIAYLLMCIGFSATASYYDFNFFYDSVKSRPYHAFSILCAMTGLLLKGVTMYGLVACMSRSTCMVNVYAVFLLVTIICKFAFVILAFTLSYGKIDGFLHIPAADYTTDPKFQDKMDVLQNTLGCCGSNSFMDYFGLEFNSDNHTAIIGTEIENGEVVTVTVPFSCCPSRYEENSPEVVCTSMWARGCKQALTEVLLQKATLISIVGISVMFVNMLGIVFALLLARCIRYTKSEITQLQWKMIEQSILAEQAEEKKKPLEEQQPVADHETNTKKDSSEFSFSVGGLK